MGRITWGLLENHSWAILPDLPASFISPKVSFISLLFLETATDDDREEEEWIDIVFMSCL
jgi:hypothetical protein